MIATAISGSGKPFIEFGLRQAESELTLSTAGCGGDAVLKVRGSMSRLAGVMITATTVMVAIILFMVGLRLMWMATHR
jgi:hypothetical protein